jgi:3'(2'), 5'-bisphosphate nucleotidase
MAEEHLTGVSTDIKTKIVKYVRASWTDVSQEAIFSAIDRCQYKGGPSGRFWALDPIDGTRGFLRGDQYAIALALIEEGNVVLGVLGCPNLPFDLNKPNNSKGCVFIAILNKGTSMYSLDSSTETMIHVSDRTDIIGSTFCESYEALSTSHSNSARLAEFLGLNNTPIRMDSQCKYGLVARGDACIYLRLPSTRGYKEKLWDHAAGWLIVKEAGGQVSDIHDQHLDFTTGRTLLKNKGIVATNGRLHSQVISGIRRLTARD